MTTITLPNYSIDTLLDRLYDSLGKNGVKSKMTLCKPEVLNKNKKTYINNFKEISEKINRNIDDVKNHFEGELNCMCSLSEEGFLVIRGIFRKPQIEKLLIDYISKFVQCNYCKSPNTQLIKENRIMYMKCSNCKADKALNVN